MTAAPTPKSKSEQKHDDILSAAMELFTSGGFENTSMDMIAGEAGVSKQTVYSHFGGKDELFHAAMAAKCAQHRINAELFTGTLSLRQTLLQFARMFSGLLLSDEVLALYRTCVAQAELHPALGQLFFEHGPQHVIQLVQGFLQRQVDRGELRIDNVGDATAQLLLMLYGESRVRRELGVPDERTPEQQQAYLESCVDLFLRGYRSR